MDKYSNLKREIQAMPENVRTTLSEQGLMEEFLKRPAYQQNDYMGWINRAVRPDTKMKRLNQMLEELKDGHLYMKMTWNKI